MEEASEERLRYFMREAMAVGKHALPACRPNPPVGCVLVRGDAIVARDFSPNRFAAYGDSLREGIENMRKLVYAFYDPKFSFKQVIDQNPELAGDITDCLSGDVNKDFSRLWKAIEEFVPVPEVLPYGAPLIKPKPELLSV